MHNTLAADINPDTTIYDLQDLKNSGWKELNDYRDYLRSEYNDGKYNPEPARLPEDNEKRIIVSDMHGNYRNLYRLLLAAGAINRDGSRNPDYWVCQIGDMIHGGADVRQADNDISLLSAQWVDCQLVGNHDLAFLTSRINSRFHGQHQYLDPDLSRRLQINLHNGHFRAAVGVDGWMVSHAGLDPRLFDQLEGQPDISEFTGSEKEIQALADSLDNLWIERMIGQQSINPITDWIGRERGGREHTGSIFWCSWSELMAGYHKRPQAVKKLKQIVGHTPRADAPACKLDSCWSTDLVGIDEGQVACLIKPAKTSKQRLPENDWQPLVLRRTTRPDPSN
jgi:hypothetical protein